MSVVTPVPDTAATVKLLPFDELCQWNNSDAFPKESYRDAVYRLALTAAHISRDSYPSILGTITLIGIAWLLSLFVVPDRVNLAVYALAWYHFSALFVAWTCRSVLITGVGGRKLAVMLIVRMPFQGAAMAFCALTGPFTVMWGLPLCLFIQLWVGSILFYKETATGLKRIQAIPQHALSALVGVFSTYGIHYLVLLQFLVPVWLSKSASAGLAVPTLLGLVYPGIKVIWVQYITAEWNTKLYRYRTDTVDGYPKHAGESRKRYVA